MNKVVLMGRLTKDPEVKMIAGENATSVASYTLAVDRRTKKEGDQNADFIRCKTFGKGAEFAQKYLKKGMKVVVSGRIQTGSYKNQDGMTVYTTDVIVEETDFAESKSASGNNQNPYPNGGGQYQQQYPQYQARPQYQQQPQYQQNQQPDMSWMNVPDNAEDENLPF